MPVARFVGAVLVALALGAGCGRAPQGVVLYQVHTISSQAGADTLRTTIAPHRVRVSHAGGDALLDYAAGQLTLVDGETRTYRVLPLAEWEAALRDAAGAGESAANAALRYEPSGAAVDIAGYPCRHYVLYAPRELLPGEREWVEQQLWVTQAIPLPESAKAAYERAMRYIASVDLGGFAERPHGVVLQVQTVVRPEGSGDAGGGTGARRRAGETETTRVFRVERGRLPRDAFKVPRGYRREARSSADGGRSP